MLVVFASHLNQMKITSDGNFQSSRFKGKGLGDDVALWLGRGYFPIDAEYRDWTNATAATEEVSSHVV